MRFAPWKPAALVLLLITFGRSALSLAEDTAEMAGDQLVVVMARELGTVRLSRSEINDIFLGRLRHLPDGRPVIPLDLDEGSVLRDRFYLEVLDRTPAQVRAHWARLLFTGRGTPPRSVDSAQQAILAIANDHRLIAYVQRSNLSDALVVVYE